MRLLVVEDDPELRGALERRLRNSGFAVDAVADLPDADALFLTARDAVADRVAGFEAGGDDYLVKPFAMAELVARVRRLCRRSPDTGPSVVTVEGLAIDHARAQVRRDGVLLTLTAKEFAVLWHLATRAGVVVSRSELIESCWDEATDAMSNTVDVHIGALRRRLGDPPLIHTVRARGYRFG